MLKGKKIILGITGGIAAYKCPHLVRLLVKAGAQVKVVMTRDAANFVTPNTLSVVSNHPVVSGFFTEENTWNNHVSLGTWADVLLIAPLTANTLAKMAIGSADNILLATYLSARGKTIVAPAMDLDMYQHPTVRKNLDQLASAGNLIIPPETGELASGLTGEGRMAEPENIVAFLEEYFGRNQKLRGKKALVNAGPTYEPIDPVRYIGNRSSGKMGIAIAERLAREGAGVTLILGPGDLDVQDASITVERVETASQMYDRTVANFEDKDIVVCAAAVADYKPMSPSADKIKKSAAPMELKLEPTKDILKTLGSAKTRQFLVGFALETSDLEKNAKEKLKNKNLDLIVANAANEPGVGFTGDTNRVTIYDRHNKTTHFELKSKTAVAADLVDYIIESMQQ
jgi:phosphopantothenoylcysteine decarboxylase / phosphopantothenate---cysteine ligase